MERKISRKLVNRFGLPNRIGTNQNNNDTNSNIKNIIPCLQTMRMIIISIR
jgi:hypothetical protein